MKLLIYEWNSFTHNDIYDALTEEGIKFHIARTKFSARKLEEKADFCVEFEELLKKERKKIEEKYKKKKLPKEILEEPIKEELNKIQSVNTKMIKLDWQDELALSNIDALKEELVNMVRKKRESGKDSFELVAEKANRMHDDRAYTAALMGYALAEERRKLIMTRPKVSHTTLLDKLTSQIRPSKLIKK